LCVHGSAPKGFGRTKSTELDIWKTDAQTSYQKVKKRRSLELGEMEKEVRVEKRTRLDRGRSRGEQECKRKKPTRGR